MILGYDTEYATCNTFTCSVVSVGVNIVMLLLFIIALGAVVRFFRWLGNIGK